MTALERLLTGYYNSSPVSEVNPGGFGDGGHVVNFPAALADLGQVVNAVVLDVEAIGDAGQAATAAGIAAGAAIEAATLAQQIASGRTLRSGLGPPPADLGREGDYYLADEVYGLYGPKTGDGWGMPVSLLAPAVSLGVSDGHIRWRLGDDVWIDLVAVADLKGTDAEEISVRASATHIQWRRGEGEWLNLVAVADLKGADASELGVQTSATHIQWRRGEGEWLDLVALADLKGTDASELSLQTSATHVQWRRGEGEWMDLAALSSLGAGAVESVAGLTGAVEASALKDALGLRSDNAQIAIALAKITGNQQGLAAGVADDFQDADGVDAAASSAALWFDNTYLSATPAPRPNNMTSNTLPAPNVASASDTFSSGTSPFYAFDAGASNEWFSNDSESGAYFGWLQRDLGVGNGLVLSSYEIMRGTNGYPTAWTLRGSNDGSSWFDVDSYSAWSPAAAGVSLTRLLPAPTPPYRYWRLQFSAKAGFGSVRNLSLIGLEPSAMSLQSIAYSSVGSPATALLTVLASAASGVITVGTNLRGYVTRDGGVNWTECALAATGTVGGITTFEGAADLSGQPSGASLKWRLDTPLADALIAVEAVVLQWG